MLRWQINDEARPWDVTPRWVRVASVKEARQPEVLKRILSAGSFDAASSAAFRARLREGRRRVIERKPRGTLRLLAIGVNDPGPLAPGLKLRCAVADAEDLCAALENSQDMLWSDVKVMPLTDEDATRRGILQALASMRAAMGPEDMAAIHFSSHGAMAEGGLWLLPHGIAGRDALSIRDGGLSAEEPHREIAALAQMGPVLVTLDCCHAGGLHTPLDAWRLRDALRQANVAVMTGCAENEQAWERQGGRNGAFNEALLWALREGDHDGDGLLSAGNLIRSTRLRLEELTADPAHPDRLQRLGHDDRLGGEVLVATGF